MLGHWWFFKLVYVLFALLFISVGNKTIDSLFPEASNMDPLLLYASTYGAFALVVVIACAATRLAEQQACEQWC